MRSWKVLLPAAVVFVWLPCSAQPRETRKHYEIRSTVASASPHYLVTEIATKSRDAQARRIYLVQDSNGDRLVLTLTNHRVHGETVAEITDLATNEFVRAVVPIVRQERATVSAAPADPGAAAPTNPAPILVELNGATARLDRNDSRSSEWRESRSTLRRAATSDFLERLERLRAITVPGHELADFCGSLLRYILYNEACAATIMIAPLQPDCAYDAAFRYPCSDKQKLLIKRAAAQRTTLVVY
jgi:hypothetical protein